MGPPLVTKKSRKMRWFGWMGVGWGGDRAGMAGRVLDSGQAAPQLLPCPRSWCIAPTPCQCCWSQTNIGQDQAGSAAGCFLGAGWYLGGEKNCARLQIQTPTSRSVTPLPCRPNPSRKQHKSSRDAPTNVSMGQVVYLNILTCV